MGDSISVVIPLPRLSMPSPSWFSAFIHRGPRSIYVFRRGMPSIGTSTVIVITRAVCRSILSKITGIRMNMRRFMWNGVAVRTTGDMTITGMKEIPIAKGDSNMRIMIDAGRMGVAAMTDPER